MHRAVHVVYLILEFFAKKRGLLLEKFLPKKLFLENIPQYTKVPREKVHEEPKALFLPHPTYSPDHKLTQLSYSNSIKNKVWSIIKSVWFWFAITAGLASAVDKVLNAKAIRGKDNVLVYSFLYLLLISIFSFSFSLPFAFQVNSKLITLAVGSILF